MSAFALLRSPLLAACALAAARFAARSRRRAPVCEGRDLSRLDPAVKPDLPRMPTNSSTARACCGRSRSDGLAPSYLYGTIHSTQPTALALAREAAAVTSTSAKTVATELGGPFDAGRQVSVIAAHDARPRRSSATRTLSSRRSCRARRRPRRGFPRRARLSQGYGASSETLVPRGRALAAGLRAEGASGGACPRSTRSIAAGGVAAAIPVVGLETRRRADRRRSPPRRRRSSAQLLIAGARAARLDDDAYVTLLQPLSRRPPGRTIAVLDALPELTRRRARRRDGDSPGCCSSAATRR